MYIAYETITESSHHQDAQYVNRYVNNNVYNQSLHFIITVNITRASTHNIVLIGDFYTTAFILPVFLFFCCLTMIKKRAC